MEDQHKLTYNKKREVTIIELENHEGKKYKVTKRIPELRTADTKIFKSREEVIEQFKKWLE